MLDEFSSAKITDKKPAASTPPTTATTSSSPAAPPSTAPPKPASQTKSTDDDVNDDDDDEFAKQMQAGMANLIAQLDNPDIQKDFEKMMKELGAGAIDGDELDPTAAPIASAPSSGATPAVAPTTTTTAAAPPPPPQASSSNTKKPAEASFQDTIRKTMERMQNSGETASAAASGTGSEEDMLAQMLREMESGNFGGGNEEDLNKMLMGMMEQLTNKEILYDPMKELHDKFPAWLRDNKDSCTKEDLARYEEQKTVVDEIVARFERKGYTDENVQDREYIVERMQKVSSPAMSPTSTSYFPRLTPS